MNDARSVRLAEPVGDLHRDLQQTGPKPCLSRESRRRSVLPATYSINYVIASIVGGDVVDRDDVRVIQCGGRLGFADEALLASRIGDTVCRQHLDGDEAVSLGSRAL